MLPTIGYLVGFYMLIRMIQILVMTPKKKGSKILRAFAILGIVIAVGGIAFFVYKEIMLIPTFQDINELLK